MKKILFRAVTIISLFIVFSSGLFLLSFAEDELPGNSLAYTDEVLSGDNEKLIQGTVLDYFRLREKYLRLSYDEVSQIEQRVIEYPSLAALHRMLVEVMKIMEDKRVFLLEEDIFIDNIPQFIDFPFYRGRYQERHISRMSLYAERLYSDNLKLNYHKNNLIKMDDEYFINPAKAKPGNELAGAPDSTGFLPQGLKKEASLKWNYGLGDDNLNNFFFWDLRQWMKGYEEEAAMPIIYNDAVLLRNEYKIFCVDTISGKELWSFSGQEDRGHQQYQTYRHPHHNSYGYEIMREGDVLYAELDGALTAVDLRDILRPHLLWQRSLGEYTLCVKPVKIDNTLIVGLINARSELWICGFDAKTGNLKWSTYIATTSFLSPASTISTVNGNRVFVCTNNGVIVCINGIDGEIIWVRKYEPKKFSLPDYWLKKYYKALFSDKGSIEHDTQFIQLCADGFLYYKPRECDYLYILDSLSGELKDKILIDADKYCLLNAGGGRVVLLKKIANGNNMELIVFDSISGKQIFNREIDSGILRGVKQPSYKETLIKIGNKLHILAIGDESIGHNIIDGLSLDSWLLNVDSRYLFEGRDRVISCLDIEEREPGYCQGNWLDEALKERKRIKEDFAGAAKLRADSTEAKTLRNDIMHRIQGLALPINELYPLILNYYEFLHTPPWQDFFDELRKLYGKEIVTYKNIEIRFANYLIESGLSRAPSKSIGKPKLTNNNRNTGNSGFSAVGGIRVRLLPVSVIKGQMPLDFFLLLNNDEQLVCVNESGVVCWMSKTFYHPVINKTVDQSKDKNIGRMYADNIEAFLYGDILIINDSVNVVARDIKDGRYIWSMTNKTDKFIEEKSPVVQNQSALFKEYGINASFLADIMFHTKFIDDYLVVVHGKDIYRINPETGFPKKFNQVDNMEGVIKVLTFDKKIYLLDYSLNSLRLININLEKIRDFPLDFLEDKQAYYEIALTERYIIFYANPLIYLIDTNTGKLKRKVTVDSFSRSFLEISDDKLLLIAPFDAVICYDMGTDYLDRLWRYELIFDNKQKIFSVPAKNSKYYFINDGYLLAPYFKDNSYFIVSLDIATGKKQWDMALDVSPGLFYALSNCEVTGSLANFIITTMYQGNTEGPLEPINTVTHLESTFLVVNLADGNTLKKERLPGRGGYHYVGLENLFLVKTKNYLVYSYAQILKGEKHK